MEAAAREAPGGLQGQDSGAAGAGAIEGVSAVGEVMGADMEAGEAGLAVGVVVVGGVVVEWWVSISKPRLLKYPKKSFFLYLKHWCQKF